MPVESLKKMRYSRRQIVKALGHSALAWPLLGCTRHATVFTPEDFRRPGDSDRIALQRLADQLGATVHGRIDRAYRIDRQIEIVDKSDFKLFGSGSITIEDNTPPDYGGSALYLAGCRHFMMAELTCDGNRSRREAREAAGHLIVLDACRDFHLLRVKAINGTSDGFIVHTSKTRGTGPGGQVVLADIPSGWLMENCEAHNNFRQGLSVIESIDFKIIGGIFARTSGSWDAEGSRGPSAGIDLEPDEASDYPAGRLSQGTISGVSFVENQGPGLQISGIADTHSITVDRCMFDGNRRAAIICGARDCQILHPLISRWTNQPYVERSGAPIKRGAIDLPMNAGPRISIVAPEFVDCDNGASTGNPLIYAHGLAREGILIDRMRAGPGASFIASLHSPGVSFTNAKIDLTGARIEPAFVFLGERPKMTNSRISNVFERLIYSAAIDLAVTGNSITVAVASETNAIVSASEGKTARIHDNEIMFRTGAHVVEYDLPVGSEVIDNRSYGNANPLWFRAPSPRAVANNIRYASNFAN